MKTQITDPNRLLPVPPVLDMARIQDRVRAGRPIETLEIQAESVSRHRGGIYIDFENPLTNEMEWAQGEFYFNKEKRMYEHTVYVVDSDDVAFVVTFI